MHGRRRAEICIALLAPVAGGLIILARHTSFIPDTTKELIASAAAFTIIASATVVALKARRDRRRKRLLQQHRCPCCEYDLRASPERCPECGWDGEGADKDT
jgi:hypothetical protein